MTTAVVLLVIALISGYCLCTRFLPLRYLSARESGYRLYFRAAYWGLVQVFAVSLLLSILFRGFLLEAAVPAVPSSTYLQAAYGLLTGYMKSMQGPLGELSAVLSVPLALLLSAGLNLLYRSPDAKARLLRKAIDSRDLEMLVLHALETSQLLLVTLDSGAVYAGLITRAPDPTEPREHLRIMPTASGYREPDTQSIRLTVDYNEVVNHVRNSSLPALSHLNLEDFEVVIPSARIVSAHVFDPTLHQRLSASEGP